MAEQQLNLAQIRSVLQQVDGEGVTQGVRRNGLTDVGNAPRDRTSLLDGFLADVGSGNVAWK